MSVVFELPVPIDQYVAIPNAGILSTLYSRILEHPFNLFTLLVFFLAIIHMLLTSRFTKIGHHFERRRIIDVEQEGRDYVRERDLSFRSELFCFLGEIEVVFALWAIVLVIGITIFYNWDSAVSYLNNRNYTEALFVIVVMTLASTRPILRLAHRLIESVAKLFGGGTAAWWLCLLTIGPLLGSVITEPGAMTITALLLSREFFARRPRKIFAYATIGLLFANISVGGVLTQFAAPPVLVVANKWGWTAGFMLLNFGWKAVVGIVASNVLYLIIFWREFGRMKRPLSISPVAGVDDHSPIPLWITIVHVILLALVVFSVHNSIVFIGIFLLFLGFFQATAPHQRPLNLRLPLLVGLFLAGLMIHGGLQAWWIAPILSSLSEVPLMIFAAFLTTFNDNAAITYLGSLSPHITGTLKYALMAGALTGGGLTVMANAPNPAGQQILGRYFSHGISPLGLFLGAITPTIIIGCAFMLL